MHPVATQSALHLYEKLCTMDNANGCYELQKHQQNAIALDKLEQLFNKGLLTAGNHLGLIYKNGYGVPVDREKAAKYLQKSCEQGLVSAPNESGQGLVSAPYESRQALVSAAYESGQGLVSAPYESG